jgi:hypothetical protein
LRWLSGVEAYHLSETYLPLKVVVMKHLSQMILAVVMVNGAMDAMAIEETSYNVVKKDRQFEIRNYAPHVLAETIAEGDMGQAGNSSFGILFRYISGSN